MLFFNKVITDILKMIISAQFLKHKNVHKINDRSLAMAVQRMMYTKQLTLNPPISLV